MKYLGVAFSSPLRASRPLPTSSYNDEDRSSRSQLTPLGCKQMGALPRGVLGIAVVDDAFSRDDAMAREEGGPVWSCVTCGTS